MSPEVEDEWFEILLPSLQLVVTDKVPPEKLEKAEFTLKRLCWQNGSQVMRQRQVWYNVYCAGSIDLERIRKMAPLIARAVKKHKQILTQNH